MSELLKVLDMTEDEQRKEIGRNIYPKPWYHLRSNEGDIICVKCRLTLKRVRRCPIGPDHVVKGYDTVPGIKKECSEPKNYEGSLAGLAFRLRDEAKKSNLDNWWEACWEVHNAFLGNSAPNRTAYNAETWVLEQGPIFWIITALIAKENE